MKRDFNGWLRSLGAHAPVASLTALREWNINHQRAGAIKYGQTNLDISDEMDVVADRARYDSDRRKDIRLSKTNGLDAAIQGNKLDALLFPGVSSANIAARTGYPTVTVPYALLPVPNGTMIRIGRSGYFTSAAAAAGQIGALVPARSEPATNARRVTRPARISIIAS